MILCLYQVYIMSPGGFWVRFSLLISTLTQPNDFSLTQHTEEELFSFSSILLVPVCWNLDVPPVARTFAFDRNNLFCVCSQFAGCSTISLLWVPLGSKTHSLLADLLKVMDFWEMMLSQGDITTYRLVLSCISKLIAVGLPLIESPSSHSKSSCLLLKLFCSVVPLPKQP